MRTLLPALRLSLLAGAAGLSSVPPKGPRGAFGKGKFGGGKFGGPADPRGGGSVPGSGGPSGDGGVLKGSESSSFGGGPFGQKKGGPFRPKANFFPDGGAVPGGDVSDPGDGGETSSSNPISNFSNFVGNLFGGLGGTQKQEDGGGISTPASKSFGGQPSGIGAPASKSFGRAQVEGQGSPFPKSGGIGSGPARKGPGLGGGLGGGGPGGGLGKKSPFGEKSSSFGTPGGLGAKGLGSAPSGGLGLGGGKQGLGGGGLGGGLGKKSTLGQKSSPFGMPGGLAKGLESSKTQSGGLGLGSGIREKSASFKKVDGKGGPGLGKGTESPAFGGGLGKMPASLSTKLSGGMSLGKQASLDDFGNPASQESKLNELGQPSGRGAGLGGKSLSFTPNSLKATLSGGLGKQSNDLPFGAKQEGIESSTSGQSAVSSFGKQATLDDFGNLGKNEVFLEIEIRMYSQRELRLQKANKKIN